MEEEKTTPKAMRRSQLHDCTNADVQSEYSLKNVLEVFSSSWKGLFGGLLDLEREIMFT